MVRIAAPLSLVALLLVLAAAVPAAAQAQSPVAWGAFTPGAPESRATMDAFNARVGRKAAIWHTYKNFDQEAFPTITVGTATDAGGVPMITWEPFNRSLEGIARGDYDDYIRRSARQAVSFGKPILLRFAHEMNGDWYPWSLNVNGNTAGDYINAWRHVVRVFRNENAHNVKHVWAPNIGTFTSLWPGDDFVDYLGLDGYNWGAKYNNWESFEQVFDSSYRSITRLSKKPLLITEVGANERGGDKPAWVRHAFSRQVAERYPQMRAIIWFDENKEADWRVNSSSETLSAFRAALNQNVFDLDATGIVGLAGAGVGSDPIPPPATPPATADPLAPNPPAQASGALRCSINPRGALRRSGMWTVNIPIRCNRTSSSCHGVVKIRHVGTGRTLGTAEVRLYSGRRAPVRVGLPGWARSSLVGRSSVATRVTMRAGGGCRGAGGTRRVTLRG